MRTLSFALACCVTLGACAGPVATIPLSATAGPGAALMSPFDAGVIFADTCLTRGPKFENALEGLPVHNMTQNSSTGTYYHNQANMSVKVTSQQCSMVYATDQDSDDAVRGLAQGTASMTSNLPDGIQISSQPASDGLTYFRLAIPSQ